MPYKSIEDAPASWKKLDGATLTLAQINWIAKVYDGLKSKEDAGEIESASAVAINNFKKSFVKKGNSWVKKEKSVKESTIDGGMNELRDKLRQALKTHFGISYWLIDVVDNKVIYEESDELSGDKYQVTYKITKDVITFGDPEKIEIKQVIKKIESFHEAINTFQIFESKKEDGSEWDVVLIAEGESDNIGTSGNQRYYPEKTLKAAIKLFENAHAMAYKFEGKINDLFDHERDKTREAKPEGLVGNQVGFFNNVHFGKFKDSKGQQRNGILARFHILEGAKWLRENLLDAWKHGKQLLGFSIDAEGSEFPNKIGDKLYDVVTNITNILENTVVTRPAAGGQVIRLVASQIDNLKTGNSKMDRKEIIKLLMEKAAHLLKDKDTEKMEESDLLALLAEALGGQKKEEPSPKPIEKPIEEPKKEDDKINESLTKIETAEKKINESLKNIELKEAKLAFKSKLSESNLPNAIKTKLEKQYSDDIVLTDEQIDTLLAQEQEAYAKLTETLPQSHSNVAITSDEKTKFKLAMDGMFEGEDQKDKDGKKVRMFTSIKEAYATILKQPSAVFADPSLILHDAYWYMPQLEEVSFAESYNIQRKKALLESARLTEALTTSDWAEILADSLNKKMMKEFSSDQYQDWRKLVSTFTPVNNFLSQKRLMMGGYGILPTVSEQGTYTELTSPGDTHQTYTPAKKGGLESITMEMIANDDVGSIRLIPIRLGKSAAMTIHRSIFGMLYTNLEGDASTTLASSSRGNATGSSTALSGSALETALSSMRGLTVYGDTSDYVGMGYIPKYLVVSPAKEGLARRIFTSNVDVGTGVAAASTGSDALSTIPNIHKGQYEPIVVPYWTTSTAWWVIADPRSAPTIEVGFYRGRQEPELFVQDNPTVGSVFTADKITYKIRFIYGYNTLDYRSFYYSE